MNCWAYTRIPFCTQIAIHNHMSNPFWRSIEDICINEIMTKQMIYHDEQDWEYLKPAFDQYKNDLYLFSFRSATRSTGFFVLVAQHQKSCPGVLRSEQLQRFFIFQIRNFRFCFDTHSEFSDLIIKLAPIFSKWSRNSIEEQINEINGIQVRFFRFLQ